MDRSRLESIKSELRRLEDLDGELESLKGQKANIRARDLQRVAVSLGFISKRKKRRGEPVWIEPNGATISIPVHSGTLGVGLAVKIIKGLQGVIFSQIEKLVDEEARIKNQQNQLSQWKRK